MKTRDALLLGFGVVLGLFAGGALLGKARAQIPAPVVRYQYMCQAKLNGRIWEVDIQQRLNQLGAEGWHLLSPRYAANGPFAYSDIYCFERPY
jgi:hypothetical protein